MSPGPRFSHWIPISSLLPKGQRGSPLPHLQRSRVTDSLKFWCSALIYVPWFRKMDWPKNPCLIQLTLHLTMPTVFVRNGTHNDHPPCIKEKKFFFLCTGQPKTIAAIIPSLMPMSKGNLAAKQNQQGNYISNFSWNLDSMVTLHLVLLTS